MKNDRIFAQGVETGSVDVVVDRRGTVCCETIKHLPSGTQGNDLVPACDQSLHDGQTEEVEVEIEMGEKDEFHEPSP